MSDKTLDILGTIILILALGGLIYIAGLHPTPLQQPVVEINKNFFGEPNAQ